jgi:predicted TIM-barrel fold metal-dependent hydrolase
MAPARADRTEARTAEDEVSNQGQPAPPVFLQRVGTDEYVPLPLNEQQRRAARKVIDRGPDDAARCGQPLADYWSSRLGTAAGLRAINEESEATFFEVPAEATREQEAADETFQGHDVVIDVHTHYMAERDWLHRVAAWQMNSFRLMMPDWWTGLDGIDFYSFAEYLRCVFVESETAVAVLTSPPADGTGVPYLTNEELVGTRELVDRLAGTGRMLNHLSVHPDRQSELEKLESWRDRYHPVAWKVYTLGRMGSVDGNDLWEPGTQWMLDDEQTGIPFLELSRKLGVRRVCAHKGLSSQEPCGSPRDIGPVARLFPDMTFCVYHSGCEPDEAEGPYTEATAHRSTNRLITALLENSIAPGTNVYADLGTVWFTLLQRPLEAAHLLGKLLLWVGEDNVLWGTDSVWYGPTQPIIDAFRVFQIPDGLCEDYGYPKLTPEIRAKILGRNAARLYDIDLEAARQSSQSDDLAWVRTAMRECGSAL